MAGLRERKKEQTRQAILDAAAEVTAEVGVAPASIKDIAARADVGFGTVYNYFGSKDGLIVALLQRATDDALRRGEAVLEQSATTPPEAVKTLLLIYAKVVRKHFRREVLREIFVAALGLPPEQQRRFMSFDQALMGQLGRLLALPPMRVTMAADVSATEAAGLLYGAFANELLMYLSVPTVSAAAFRAGVDRKVDVVFAGLTRRPK